MESRAFAGLALLAFAAGCQDPDPVPGVYSLRSVIDASQSTQSVPLPATVHNGLSADPQSRFVIHDGTLSLDKDGVYIVIFGQGEVGQPPSGATGTGTWTREDGGIHFSNGAGFDVTSSFHGDTLPFQCFAPNLTCNFVKK